MVHLSCRMDPYRCLIHYLLGLHLSCLNHVRLRHTVKVEVVDLCKQFVFMSVDCHEKVFTEVQVVDEGFLLTEDGHQDIFHADFQLGSVHISEVLLEALET